MSKPAPHPSLPTGLRRPGRGAQSNATNRFETTSRERFDDGWGLQEDDTLLRTEVREERARSAITRNISPDIRFDRSINPYRGCEHGCAYCYARPSHAYLGLSPGLDFETRLVARPGLAGILEAELRRPAYRPAPIALGSNTDPYQPIEAHYRITREILEVLSAFRHPLMAVTRGTLVERDADILGEMGRARLANVSISIPTLDAALARAMEPRAPARRLRMIETLARVGCPVRVMVSPSIPGLTDHEMEAILQAAHAAGATSASSILLRLPGEVSALFGEWLRTHRPDREAKVMGRVREMREGLDYKADFGTRMTGTGIWADLNRQRLRAAMSRLGMAEDPPELRCDLFEPPLAKGRQLALF